MLRYIGKRILIAIPTFLGITVLVYVLSSMAPGTPLEMIFNDPNATAEQMAAMKAKLGLDQPVMIQYFNWLVQLLHGNMGASYRTGHAVWADISERIGPTLLLTMSSLVFSILIAIPLGIMSAYKPYTAWDYISSAFSFIGAAIPNFFAGLVFVYLLSVVLKIFPSGGMYDTSGVRTLPMLLHHLFLPMLVLSIQQVGSLIRQTRGAMLDVLQEDYIRTARAKGLKEKVVIYSHAWRNALLPVITLIISWFMSIFMGSIVIEQIFQLNGIGKMYYVGLMNQDYDMALAVNMLYCIITLLSNLITDLSYGLVDPRVRIDK